MLVGTAQSPDTAIVKPAKLFLGLFGMDPRKLIYLLFRWGWRGPLVLIAVIFGVWLYSLWVF
jgi:hypothetical protein